MATLPAAERRAFALKINRWERDPRGGTGRDGTGRVGAPRSRSRLPAAGSRALPPPPSLPRAGGGSSSSSLSSSSFSSFSSFSSPHAAAKRSEAESVAPGKRRVYVGRPYCGSIPPCAFFFIFFSFYPFTYEKKKSYWLEINASFSPPLNRVRELAVEHQTLSLQTARLWCLFPGKWWLSAGLCSAAAVGKQNNYFHTVKGKHRPAFQEHCCLRQNLCFQGVDVSTR